MQDIIFITAILVFYIVAIAYLSGCDGLRKGEKNK